MLHANGLIRCSIIRQNPIRLIARNWHNEPIKVVWERPEIGWTKLNFDGSCKCKTGKASIGGIFRNDKAEFMLGYSESIGKANSCTAELRALERGLELLLENGWNDHHVWLEGDSKSLVNIMAEKRTVRCAQVQKLVTNINLVIPELRKCVFTHVYREGNRAADKLAQMGHHMKSPQVWHDIPPKQVLRIVREDAEGKTFLRRR